jgi:hypothetical protein
MLSFGVPSSAVQQDILVEYIFFLLPFFSRQPGACTFPGPGQPRSCSLQITSLLSVLFLFSQEFDPLPDQLYLHSYPGRQTLSMQLLPLLAISAAFLAGGDAFPMPGLSLLTREPKNVFSLPDISLHEREAKNGNTNNVGANGKATTTGAKASTIVAAAEAKESSTDQATPTSATAADITIDVNPNFDLAAATSAEKAASVSLTQV